MDRGKPLLHILLCVKSPELFHFEYCYSKNHQSHSNPTSLLFYRVTCITVCEHTHGYAGDPLFSIQITFLAYHFPLLQRLIINSVTETKKTWEKHPSLIPIVRPSHCLCTEISNSASPRHCVLYNSIQQCSTVQTALVVIWDIIHPA